MILIYSRVSTLDQINPSCPSPEEQVRKCEAWATMMGHDGQYNLVRYVDKGVSGAMSLSERPMGAQLLADAQKGDTVVATKLDRLFRSASDALSTVDGLHKCGVGVVLLDMGNDSLTSNGTAKLFFGILASIAEFERERITERFVEGRNAKARLGGYTGGPAPYGFRPVGRGRESRLEPDPGEQEIIRTIVQLSQTQGTTRFCNIRRKLNEAGIRSRGAKPWQSKQIIKILENYQRRQEMQ